MVLGKRALDLAPGLHCPRSPFFRSCMWQYSWSYIICWPYSPYNTLLYTCRKSPGSVTRGGGGGAGRALGRACHAFSTLCPSWHGLRCVEAKNVSQQTPHAHSVKVTRGSTPTRRPSDCASLDARTPGLQAPHPPETMGRNVSDAHQAGALAAIGMHSTQTYLGPASSAPKSR